jgi:putative Holliday junction resolvase
MGRIIAIDFGLKRTGIAVTDPLQIIGSPLETIPTSNLFNWLTSYFTNESVERIVIGMPSKLDLTDTHITQDVKRLIEKLKTSFPDIPITEIDERFTSKMALQSMVLGGMKKKDRKKKENVDKISAALILQSFLDQHKKKT